MESGITTERVHMRVQLLCHIRLNEEAINKKRRRSAAYVFSCVLMQEVGGLIWWYQCLAY